MRFRQSIVKFQRLWRKRKHKNEQARRTKIRLMAMRKLKENMAPFQNEKVKHSRHTLHNFVSFEGRKRTVDLDVDQITIYEGGVAKKNIKRVRNVPKMNAKRQSIPTHLMNNYDFESPNYSLKF